MPRKRQTKAERIADLRIEHAYRASCCGIQINIMDISKVFAEGRKHIAAGVTDADLQTALRAFAETIRQN